MSPPTQAQVVAVMEQIGGGVSVDELVHKFGCSSAEMIDVLIDLEDEGRVEPTLWRIVNEVRA